MAAEITYSISENCTQQTGLRKSGTKPIGKKEGKILLQKVFQQDQNNDKFVPMRTFGDISNRLGANLKSCRKEELKFPKFDEPVMKSSKATAQIAKTSSQFYSPFIGPEFRPDIKEIEDYDDVLPPNLQLNEVTIRKFVQCWNKKFYGGKIVSEVPSTSLNLDLLNIDPIMEDPCVRETLHPVIEDFVYDVPPNSFLDI